MTQSRKRRTTSKSGSSARSTKSDSAEVARSSSQTAAPSFVLDGSPPPEGHQRYLKLLSAAEGRLMQLLTRDVPKNALLRARHKQAVAKERRLIASLNELLT